MTSRQQIRVAAVMERIAAPNRWEAWKFRLVDVIPDECIFGSAPRRLVDDGKVSRWLYPGFAIALYADECKGYYLNLTSGRPSWFVSWVVEEADPTLPMLTGVGVSYIEADRRMASEEHVETVPLAPELCEWLRLFTNAHYRPETRRKVRAMSFLSAEERERHMAALVSAAASDLPAPAPAEADAAAEADREASQRARNAGLREMFHADPHFRQSDGLDVADDEVHEIEGTPVGRQRKILQARALGLLDDELLDQELPPSDPPPASSGG
ncbi:MAG: DUF3305 domain-containing protein [Burkholderiales bacterium]|nr:DUF3305 domain-containing protein [Burkholderiales bacterium]